MAAPPPPKRKWGDVATVTLLVGENKTPFHVHEGILFEESTVFKAAFTSDFRESSERTMTLPEEKASVFERFLEWLYHGRHQNPPLSHSNPIPKGCRFKPYVQLYILADKYDVFNLKNSALSEMFSFFKSGVTVPEQPTIAHAFEHTCQNAAVRRLFADYLYDCPHGWYQQEETQTWFRTHPDISTEVLFSFARRKKAGKVFYEVDKLETYLEKKGGRQEMKVLKHADSASSSESTDSDM